MLTILGNTRKHEWVWIMEPLHTMMQMPTSYDPAALSLPHTTDTQTLYSTCACTYTQTHNCQTQTQYTQTHRFHLHLEADPPPSTWWTMCKAFMVTALSVHFSGGGPQRAAGLLFATALQLTYHQLIRRLFQNNASNCVWSEGWLRSHADMCISSLKELWKQTTF